MILKSLYLKNILLKKIIAYYEVYSIIIKKEKFVLYDIYPSCFQKYIFFKS